MEKIYNRIGKKIDLKKLSVEICEIYNIGKYLEHKLIENVGIDDLSYILYTDKSKFLIKIINYNKTIQEINQFIKKNDIIAKNKIQAPRIVLNNRNHIYSTEINGLYINCCVIEYIEGNDLYTIGERISKNDIDKLIDIIIPMHKIQDKLKIDYDEYCFMKINEAYKKTSHKISKKLKNEVKNFLEEYKKIDFKKLPNCFVHGDLISSNIMKDKNEKLWLIDFFESGTGIRILDIVKILNGVLFLYYDKENSKDLETYFLKQYQKYSKLTEYELKVLPTLRKADSYVGLMLGEYDLLMEEKRETKFWLKNDEEIISNV